MEENRLVNRLVQICYYITSIAFTLSQIGEVIAGKRTVLYVVVFALLLWMPLFINQIIYLKSPSNEYSKHIVAIGYGLFYIFVMLTAINPMTFIFAIPMLCVMVLYQHWRYSLQVGVAVLIVNIIYIVMQIKNDTVVDQAYFEIEMGSMVLVILFTSLASKLTADISKFKLNALNNEKSQQKDTIERIENGSKVIKDNIFNLKELSNKVKNQSATSSESIDEISSGTSEVAENIQKQLGMSTDITKLIQESNNLMKELSEKFNTTIELSNTGYDNMNNLAKISEESMNSFESVKGSAQELSIKIDKAKEILDIISEITSQINLLSLNASIEAARAGENGKGFAVVATEMQQLASETKSATEDITRIFDELGEQNDVSNRTIENLQKVTMEESDIVMTTKENFNRMKNDLHDVSDNIDAQIECANKIQESNNIISSNIEDMSAFTEELMASAQATKNIITESLEDTSDMDVNIQAVYEQAENLN